jgi:hypothetical protein
MLADIRKAVQPLRAIFWGSLVVIFDLGIRLGNLKLDLLNDVVGMLLIGFGILELGKFVVSNIYTQILIFTKYVAIAATIDAFLHHFSLPPAVEMLSSILSLIVTITFVTFCHAMILLSRHYHLFTALASWQTTARLFVYLCLIPYGLLMGLSNLSMLLGRPIRLDLGWTGFFILVPILMTPLIHFFLSTSRMAREAAERGSTDADLLAVLLDHSPSDSSSLQGHGAA